MKAKFSFKYFLPLALLPSIVWGTSCPLLFMDALQTHGLEPGNPANIVFDCGAQVQGSATGILSGVSIKNPESCIINTCETIECSATGDAASPLYAGPFQSTTSIIDFSVVDFSNGIIGSGGQTEFNLVSVGDTGILTFASQGSNTVYKINNLSILQNATVNLVAGDYWISDFSIRKDAKINVIGTGTARLFFEQKTNFGKTIEAVQINTNGAAPEQLLIYGYDDIIVHKDSTLSGFIYSNKKIDIKKETVVIGAILAQMVTLDKDAKVVYNAAAAASLPLELLFPVSHFVVTHSGSGIYCLEEPITVTVKDCNDVIKSTYSETIILDTGTDKGTWTLLEGEGVLSDEIVNDGKASYTFSSEDNGVAIFGLTYSEGLTTINIKVVQESDESITDDDSEDPLVFVPSGFLLTNNPASTTAYFGPQTAGVGDTLYLKAYGVDPQDATCGVIESYEGSKNLDFWFDYVDPNTGTKQVLIDNTNIGSLEAIATTIANINFAAGISQSINTKYRDVGRITIHAKNSGLRGSTAPFVVKPAKIVIDSVLNNPGATSANDIVFKKAGESFTINVSVRDVDNNMTPNFGLESSPQGIEVRSSQLVLPIGGQNGSLDNGTITNGINFVLTNPGQLQCTTCAFDEVGIIKLQAGILNDDYLGAGDAPTRPETGNVGRFTPNHFDVALMATPEFNAGCVAGVFTYLEQPFFYLIRPDVLVTAKALSGTTTQNYQGAFWKLNISSLGAIYSTNSALTFNTTAATSDITETINGDGTGDYIFGDGGGVTFERGTITNKAPFDAEIALNITVIDSDNVAYTSNPFVIGGTSTGTGIDFNGGNGMRHGRIEIMGNCGPEIQSLTLPIEIQYYTTNAGYIKNTADSCTAFTESDFLLVADPGSLNTTPTLTLSGAGSGDLTLSAPNAVGFFEITLNLSTLPWLQYDWPHDGLADGLFDDNPQERASFGIAGCGGNVVHRQEVYGQ